MSILKPCHNCRRRRLRCDRSFPECHKCTSAGKKCLGYGKLYKWIDNIGPQNRTGEHTFGPSDLSNLDEAEPSPKSTASSVLCLSNDYAENLCGTPIVSLIDPLFQDLDLSSRHYLNYFDARFCQDLVIYDSPGRGVNPFRELVPMSKMYPFLQHIIVAVSAIHYSNAMRHFHWDDSQQSAVNSLVDALHARHRAIKSLQVVIERQKLSGGITSDPEENDALLAAVLFFVNFTLIDSGKGGWRDHMKIVTSLLNMRTSGTSSLGSLPESKQDYLTDRTIFWDVSPCLDEASAPSQYPYRDISICRSLTAQDYVASDSMAYIIWISALDSLVPSSRKTWQFSFPFDGDTANVISTLLRTEANSYHSCPSYLLYILLRASWLARAVKSKGAGTMNDTQMQSFVDLLKAAQDFDADAWAVAISAKSAAALGYVDESQLHLRRYMSNTYRAAVCLYVLLVAPELQGEVHWRTLHYQFADSLPTLPESGDLGTTILHQLSFIPNDSPLFKFTTWPLFLTGVETADTARRAWVLNRLGAMRSVAPWGMLTSTMETLREIWKLRDDASTNLSDIDRRGPDGHLSISQHRRGDSDWLLQLRDIEIECLIV